MHFDDYVARISPRRVPFVQHGNLCRSKRAGIALAVSLLVYFFRRNGLGVGSVSAEASIEVNHVCELLYHGAV
jgi:hypothetical protein